MAAYKCYAAKAISTGFYVPGAGDQVDASSNNITITGTLAIVNITTPGSADSELKITDGLGGRVLFDSAGPTMGCWLKYVLFSKGLYVVVSGTTAPYYDISFGY